MNVKCGQHLDSNQSETLVCFPSRVVLVPFECNA